jgi:hypothetical protein
MCTWLLFTVLNSPLLISLIDIFPTSPPAVATEQTLAIRQQADWGTFAVTKISSIFASVVIPSSFLKNNFHMNVSRIRCLNI